MPSYLRRLDNDSIFRLRRAVETLRLAARSNYPIVPLEIREAINELDNRDVFVPIDEEWYDRV